MRRELGATLAAAVALGGGGCGVLFDGIYLVGPRRYTESASEERPTGQTVERVEYAVERVAGGPPVLTCARRSRAALRSFTSVRTFERRGGFHPDNYGGAAVVSGIVAAVIGVSAGALCASDTNVSCWNLAFAAPFALDVGYSLLRRSTVQPPVLVGRRPGGETIVLGPPLSDAPIGCEGVASLTVGRADGPSDEQALFDGGEIPRRLLDGGHPVELGEGGALRFDGAAAGAWSADPSLALWVVDDGGRVQPVAADRCDLVGCPEQTPR